MTYLFRAARGLIIVLVELFGPSDSMVVRMALDTGATTTLVNSGVLTAIGCNPALEPERVQITTGSNVEYVARVEVRRILELGKEHQDFRVVAHTLPPSASVDGLLGLDFLRDKTLQINFADGLITLD